MRFDRDGKIDHGLPTREQEAWAREAQDAQRAALTGRELELTEAEEATEAAFRAARAACEAAYLAGEDYSHLLERKEECWAAYDAAQRAMKEFRVAKSQAKVEAARAARRAAKEAR